MANLSSLESEEESWTRGSALHKHKIPSGEAEASGPVCSALSLLLAEPDGRLHAQTETTALLRPSTGRVPRSTPSLRMVSRERFPARDGEENHRDLANERQEDGVGEGAGGRCPSPQHPRPCISHSFS